MHKAIGIGVGLAAAALVAAGCSSSSGGGGASGTGSAPGSGSGGSASAAATASGSLTTVDVGYVPFTDDAVLFLAIEHGFFAKHGLKVNVHPAATPIAIVSSMASGQYQFGFVTTPVLINSTLGGQKLQCVSVVDGQVDPNNDSASYVASAKSGITDPSQLSGKTVAVVQLASLNAFEVKKIDGDAGAKNVKYVSLPFPQMPQALQSGRIDAAVIVSPFLQTALKNGAKKLASPNSQLFPNGTVYCFGGTNTYLDGHAKVAQAFQDAMTESTLYAKDHLTEEKATLVKYLKVSSQVAQSEQIATNYVPTLNVQSISDIQDLMKELGGIKSTVDPASLVWKP